MTTLEDEAAKLLREAKALLAKAKEETNTTVVEQIKKEMHDMYSDSDSEEESDKITKALSKIKLSQVTKMRRFQKDENFSRFCERFKEYIYITKMVDDNLYMFFLQNVDDETYSILKTVQLRSGEKKSAELFCPLYKEAIYGDEKLSLKNKLRDCKQKSDENVSHYAYRLRENANIAYSDPEIGEENYLLAFLRGVKDAQMRRKLNETTLTSFEDALKLAKKLEEVDEMLNDEPEISSILKESSFSFKPSRKPRGDYSSPENRNEHDRDYNSP